MISELHADYQTLRTDYAGAKNLPQLELVHIAITEKRFAAADVQAVEAAVAALEHDCAGWSRRQSWADVCKGEAPQDAGTPLSGEWAHSDKVSSQLLFDGRAWRLIEIRECAAAEAGAIPCLKQAVSLVAERAGDHVGLLNYAIYWTGAPDDAAGLRRAAARFVGFDGGAS